MLIFPLGKPGTNGIPLATLFVCVACLVVHLFASTHADRAVLAFYPDQLDPLRMRREHRDVDPGAVPVRAERPGLAGADLHHAVHSKNTVASGGRVMSAAILPLPCFLACTAPPFPLPLPP